MSGDGGGYSGSEPVTAPGIHDFPVGSSNGQPTPEQMKRFGGGFVNGIVATVLYGLSGISIFGINPLDPLGIGYLRAWGDEFSQRANDAFNNAATAQGSANTANTGVATLAARLDAGDSGGSFITDTFDRTGSDMGSDYFQRYIGPGAGGWGTNGNSVHWSQNGAVELYAFARHNSTLLTDYQSGRLVHSAMLGASNVQPRNYILLRCNSALDTYVSASWSVDSCEIGVTVSDTYTRLGTAVAVTVSDGDRWELQVGTAADGYQFLLYQNDSLVCDRTDSGHISQMGASYRHPGFGDLAGVQFFGFFFSQIAPADIQSVAYSDRTP